MEFFFNAVAERIDGGDGDLEVMGNLPGAFALAEHAKDLKFPVTEQFQGGGGRLSLAAHELRDDGGGHLLAEVHFAAKNLVDGGFDGFAGLVFHDVTHRTRAQGALGIKGFIVHRNNQNGALIVIILDGFDEIDAAAAAQGNVDQDEVGFELTDSLKGFSRAGCFAADHELGVAFDDLAEALAEQRVVVDDKNPAFVGNGVAHDPGLSCSIRVTVFSRGRSEHALNGRSLPGLALNFERGADHAGAIIHDAQPHAGGSG